VAGLVSVFGMLNLGVLYWLADAQPESIDSTPPHACRRLRAASRTRGGGEGIKADELDKKLGYFERNAHRMHYARFRKLGMFTGSDAIEGGIKAIVVQRQAIRNALDHRRRRQHHRPALPARQRTVGRALAGHHPRPDQAARRHLTDSGTQTP
jgi:hypothetical protein